MITTAKVVIGNTTYTYEDGNIRVMVKTRAGTHVFDCVPGISPLANILCDIRNPQAPPLRMSGYDTPADMPGWDV